MDGHPEHPDADAPLDAPPASDTPAAFDPPAAQFEGFPPPVSTDAPISVVVHDEPKQRRTGVMVGLGALVAAAVGVAGFLLLRSDDAEATYSLEEATEAMAEVGTISYTMTVDAMGQETVIAAEIDNETGLGRITMQLGAMFADGVEMIVDSKNEVVYVSSDLFKGIGLDVETDWIKMDKAFIAESGDNSVFGTAASNDALQAKSLLESATSVEDLGIEEIEGEQLKHYRVTVAAEDALDLSPQLAEQYETAGGELPDEFVYDMWVSEDNQLRRLGVDVDMGQAVVATMLVITETDQPLDIELPDVGDTTDASELM